jgi:hypothetical protein
MMEERYVQIHKIPIKNGMPSPGLLTSDKLKTNSIEMPWVEATTAATV